MLHDTMPVPDCHPPTSDLTQEKLGDRIRALRTDDAVFNWHEHERLLREAGAQAHELAEEAAALIFDTHGRMAATVIEWMFDAVLREYQQPRPANTAYRKVPIPADLRWQVWERDDFTCQSCGARRDLSVDHRVAESRGGPATLANLQTLCRSCNSRKGARDA